jgi:hypothetical protein
MKKEEEISKEKIESEKSCKIKIYMDVSVAHPASYPMGTGVSFPGGKEAGV